MTGNGFDQGKSAKTGFLTHLGESFASKDIFLSLIDNDVKSYLNFSLGPDHALQGYNLLMKKVEMGELLR